MFHCESISINTPSIVKILPLIFKFWGGIPIDREINKNYVETVVELINKNKINHLAIAPEGTREKVEKWKTGFY